MEPAPIQGLWARVVLFASLALLLLVLNVWLQPLLFPPPPKPAPGLAQQPPVAEKPGEDTAQPDAADAPKEPGNNDGDKPNEPAQEQDQPKPEPTKEEPAAPRKWVAMGSADPASPYKMLVLADSAGASIPRIELTSTRFRDLEWEGAYMGHVTMEGEADGRGAPVQVVPPGTPADKAGLKVGDLVTGFDGKPIAGFDSLQAALRKSRPGTTAEVALLRNGKQVTVQVKLGKRPLEIVRQQGPQWYAAHFDDLPFAPPTDPASFLLTLNQIDDKRLDEPKDEESDEHRPKPPPEYLEKELPGVELRHSTWKIVRSTQEEVVFQRTLPKFGLEVTKIYRLVKVPQESIGDDTYPGYHLEFEIKVRNVGEDARTVAYQLDGPTGLPTEGYWYASKISRDWGSVGLRDVVVSLSGRTPELIGCSYIATDEWGTPWQGEPVTFLGVDAQYFSAVLMPKPEKKEELWFAQSRPLRVGPVDPDWLNLTNTSFRCRSVARKLEADQEFSHQFTIFAGPKKPDLLAHYGLKDLIVYGWFSWVAIFMSWILHLFYSIVQNYGLAIVMLTVVVRLAMFPLSRKAVLGAQKMQELQPELKKIQEKYKGNAEARVRAQQELFRKHKYNPAAGCLPLFLQLPIFVGLYRALSVDVELRQAPLLSESIRWCSNLAAPDMLFNWSGFMPEWVIRGSGMFSPGPYFNILPIVAVAVMVWQQKMFMPPPADEQQAMQQNMMKYMMIFMGILFFKVASGLCLYFIASSLWAVAERKLLPKAQHPAATAAPQKGESLFKRMLAGQNGSDDGSKKPGETQAAAARKKKGRR
jgi:YidC/Oxa1 family membrane protein insertase